MSQILKPSSGGGGGGGSVNTLTGNDSTPVGPDGSGNINVLGGQSPTLSISNNVAGITVFGNAGTFTETIVLTNRIQGSVTTTDATPTNVFTFSLGSTPGTYVFNISVSAFNVTDSLGAGYVTSQIYRTTGAAAVSIGVTDAFAAEEGAMSSCLVGYVSAANSVSLQVTGIAGKTIDWMAVGNYIFVS